MDLNLIQYRGASAEFVAEVGMLTLAAAALEEAIYRLGGELALEPKELRADPSSVAASRILSQLDTYGVLPPWSGEDITVPVVSDWLHAAKGCLGERHLIIHSSAVTLRRDDGDYSLVLIEQKARGRVRPASALRVRSLRERIDRLNGRAADITVGVMPQVAPGIYISYYGTGSMVVVGDKDGYPDTRSPDEFSRRADRILAFWSRFQANGGGEVSKTTSPAGARHVPPWFCDQW